MDTLVHERGREELLNALAQTLKEKSWLALKPQKVALLDALRFQKDPPLYLTLLQLENHRTLQVFLPLLWSPQRREGPGLFARTHGQPGHFYELSLDPGFYRLLLARLKEGFEGRSLRAYYRGRHPGPVPEAVDLLRPGLAAGEGVWVQLGLVQDGGLDRTERVLPRLDLPWVLRPEGGLFWERGASRRVLALTGSLPPGRPQDLFAALEVRLLESLPRLRGHAPGTPGLLPGALHETEALVRLLGVRLALLHRALGEVEGVEGGHPLLGRGLGAFLELEGEVYLVALGAEKRGTVEEDLARLAYDVERAVHLALRGPWRRSFGPLPRRWPTTSTPPSSKPTAPPSPRRPWRRRAGRGTWPRWRRSTSTGRKGPPASASTSAGRPRPEKPRRPVALQPRATGALGWKTASSGRRRRFLARR